MAREPSGLFHHQTPLPNPTSTFRAYFDHNKAIGTIGEPSQTNDGTEAYLPEDAQKQYFTIGRIRQIRSQLYPNARGPDVVRDQDLQGPYRQAFATLLYIGKGELIQHFLSIPDLQDTHLPFLQKPVRFPGDDEDFDQFSNAQWKFCAPIMKYWHGVDWDPRQILPFKCVKKLSEGNSGKAYLIEVEPSHDEILSSEASAVVGLDGYARSGESNSVNATDPHFYVLKVFRPTKRKSKEQWRKEANAHVAVRTSNDLTKDDGIVKFHGCFSQGQAFSILLEYASMGNLEQLFRAMSPPTDMKDILYLWKSYLRLIRTLHCLRRMEYLDGSKYQMCHFDIKPNNILIFPGSSGQTYDFRLKLGDLGSSVHCALLDEEETYALQNPGTRTYGAPECCRNDPLSKSNLPLNHVLPPADLWSFGCVASELATWIVRGWGGLEGYRDGRKDGHDDPDFEDADCFHNGYETLPMVYRHHKRLMEVVPPQNATHAVIPLIDRDMLQPNPKLRTDPRTLNFKAKEALNPVEKMVTIDTEADLEDGHQSFARSSSQVGLSSLLGSISPGSKSIRRSGQAELPLSPVNQINGVPAMGSAPHPAAGFSQNGRSRSISATQFLVSSPQNRTISRGRSTLPANMRADFAERPPPSSAEGSRSPYISTFNPQQLGYHHRGERNGATEIPVTPERGPKAHEASFFTDMTNSPNMFSEPESYEEHFGKDDASWMSKKASKEMDINPRQALEPPAEITPIKSPQLPFLSVDGAITWRDDTKQPRRISKLFRRSNRDDNPHWDHLTHEFEGRDFILLVDDSPSMRAHWKEVEECADLIAFCTTPYDHDGIELRYTKSEDKKRTKDPKKITENIQANKPRQSTGPPLSRRSNMNAALVKVLSKYQDQVKDEYGSGKQRKGKLKPLVLLVLTDGLWDGCDAKEPISDLVNMLQTCDRPGNLVGVQFIQFGNEREGYERLAELDDFMKKRDIVDLEPYRGGNFFKMLLGSINKAYDHSDARFSTSDRSGSPATTESPTASLRASGSPAAPNSSPQQPHFWRRTSGWYAEPNSPTPQWHSGHRKAGSRSHFDGYLRRGHPPPLPRDFGA